MRHAILLTALITGLVLLPVRVHAQSTPFGKNKVQYTDFEWYYIQTSNFDIYFSRDGKRLAEFTAEAAESAYTSISKSFRYQLVNRVPIMVYNSHNDFQQTNVVGTYLEEGIGGVTELFKNRVVVPFEGDYQKFRHVIHHELVHAVMNDMFYGGSIQSIIANNITLQIPPWFSEGLCEYEALQWETESDMFLRDATINEYLPPIQYLNGYLAYRGGQSVFYYIATKYGEQKIGEILSRIRGTRSVDQGLRSAIGLNIEELSERWQREQKVLYWPDIAKRDDPADYARRLTDHTKDGSFLNTSPVISPQGDRIAFISNRDDYFDVYVMNAVDGSNARKIVEGQRTADFEELHLLTPGMTWSPDGRSIALAVKSGSQDAIMIIDVNGGDEEKLEFSFDAIYSVSWSPGNQDSVAGMSTLAFIGVKEGKSDVYLYDLMTRELINLTDDMFSDADPEWSADGRSIFFTSDRRDYLTPASVPADFKMHRFDYQQHDLYRVNTASRIITRVADLPSSMESSPVSTGDGKHLLFISDMNGINNIYLLDLANDSIRPLTNSLNGVYQLSLSRDGTRLAFASLAKGGYDIFVLRNSLERKLNSSQPEPTEYIKRRDARKTTVQSPPATPDSMTARDDEIIIKTAESDSLGGYDDDIRVDLRHHVFSDAFTNKQEARSETTTIAPITDNIDEAGNYRVNKYKLNFSPDIVYGSAGYNTYYGVQGSTIMAFSDMLGDHQIFLLTTLLFDLKNSDYALAYLYLPKRIDYGFQAFHSARFLILEDGPPEGSLYRFRNYGVTTIASLPLSRFNRWEFSLSWFNITRENLDDPAASTQRRSIILPSLSYVHDNSLWGLIAPDNGKRYNLSVMASPKLGGESLGFYTVTGDYRIYHKLGRNYTFAIRFAGGGSFGENPQRFVIGGVDNWVNREFENDRIPVESAEDYVFLTSGIPLRGYNYSAKVGTKYGLMNAELRFPFFGYFVAGPLPVFFQSLSGALFVDAGAAWTRATDFKAFDKDRNGNAYMRDLLVGTGYGVRMILLGFLLKMDVAWAFNWQDFSPPKYYFSLGADF